MASVLEAGIALLMTAAVLGFVVLLVREWGVCRWAQAHGLGALSILASLLGTIGAMLPLAGLIGAAGGAGRDEARPRGFDDRHPHGGDRLVGRSPAPPTIAR